jgi:hypothetical protein
MSSVFWMEKLKNEIGDFSCGISVEKKLNIITAAGLICGGVLYVLKNEYWLHFTVGVLLIVVVAYYVAIKRREHFSLVPTYTGTDFQQTVVAPTYAEEWQIPPPAYDLYTRLPPQQSFKQPLRPQNYPYGQYLTKTNLLPSDEYYVHNNIGGTKQAREYINSTFLRHDLAFKENMSRILKKKLQRRFRSDTYHDVVSPFSSY